MHIESISNGLGAQSLWLLILAIRGQIPATVSITADTGSEQDCLWSTGRRSTAKEYFDEVVIPLCHGSRVTPFFIRACTREKLPMVSIVEHTRRQILEGKFTSIKIPLFGSKGGRYKQSCTQRWKIMAINQQLRRLGAKTARTAQGIHFAEAARRVKGKYIGVIAGFDTYRTTIRRKKVETEQKWLSHYYPLVDLKLNREAIRSLIKAEGIPYLHSSECDLCPHKDLARWERTSEDVIRQGEELESSLGGKFFLTDRRIPLRQAIAAMQADRAKHPERFKAEQDFGCQNHTCGV